MNKELFDHLPTDEQPIAARINKTAENMKVPQGFQWNLETQLMEKYQSKSQPKKNWFSKIIVPASGMIAAVLGFFLLNWVIRSTVRPEHNKPAAQNTEVPVETFESKIRNGDICQGPLAVAHGFSAALTNEDKTAFKILDEEKVIGELRSLAWSPNGEQLAIITNTRGSGNIYLTDASVSPLQPVLVDSPLGYLMDGAWSHDGKQFLVWSLQDNTIVYVVNVDGTDLKEIQLGMQLLSTPQFTPDNKGIIFHGADTSSSGLFEFNFNDSTINVISNLVEDDTSFAWSANGAYLAYFEMDRTTGEARLVSQEWGSGVKTVLATLPIPKGSGSSIPDVANLNWSQDGTKLVFEFGRNAQDRAIYLVHVNGSGMIKVTESAHAPTISSDGNCLAYISNKQVFIVDVKNISTPYLLTDLPASRGSADFRLDKLQWQP